MQKSIKAFALMQLAVFMAAAQQYDWKADFHYFFDNTEYEGSSFAEPQTMNGIWLMPEGQVTWQDRHSLHVGVDLLKIPGTDETVDKVDLAIYYEYKSPNVQFRTGSFPRRESLEDYNNFFFKDSVNNYLPMMRGIYWRLGSDKSFFKAWMDWVSYATATSREKFFIGFSGKLTKGLFYGNFQSYMFHNANTRPRIEENQGVRENMLLQASLGLDYARQNNFEGNISAGVLAGYERDRFNEELHKPVGFVANANVEYCGLGTKNMFYWGDPRMQLYHRYGGDLYWGTQFLQGKSYLKSDWYVHAIQSDWANADIDLILHVSEGKVFFQQMMNVIVTLDKDMKHAKINNPFPWMKIFDH